MKIKKVTYSVGDFVKGENEFCVIENINEYDCKESSTGYVIERESNFGGKTTRLKKEDLLRIDSMVAENLYYLISFYTWYLPKDEQKAKKMVINWLKATAKKQFEIADKLYKTTQSYNA